MNETESGDTASVIGRFGLRQELQNLPFIDRIILHSPVGGIRDIDKPVQALLGGMGIELFHFFVKIKLVFRQRHIFGMDKIFLRQHGGKAAVLCFFTGGCRSAQRVIITGFGSVACIDRIPHSSPSFVLLAIHVVTFLFIRISAFSSRFLLLLYGSAHSLYHLRAKIFGCEYKLPEDDSLLYISGYRQVFLRYQA